MNLEIITPDKKIFTGEATAVTFPGVEGQFQVLNAHAPLVSTLGTGSLVVEADGKKQNYTIDGGVVEVLNNKEAIDHFLFFELPNFSAGILNVNFLEDKFQTTIKYKVKKIIGKTVPEYYSLKEINDKLLLHLISFYNGCNYSYRISDDLKTINLKIQKCN